MIRRLKLLCWHKDLPKGSGTSKEYWEGDSFNRIVEKLKQCEWICLEISYNGRVIQ